MEINIDNLSKEVYEITQNCGTEPPFSGKLLNEKEKERIYALFAKKNFLIQIRNLSLVLDGRVFLHLLKIKSYVKKIVLSE